MLLYWLRTTSPFFSPLGLAPLSYLLPEEIEGSGLGAEEHPSWSIALVYR